MENPSPLEREINPTQRAPIREKMQSRHALRDHPLKPRDLAGCFGGGTSARGGSMTRTPPNLKERIRMKQTQS